ncbi:MAG: hypothetical protein LBM76_01530 [Mycoplasmataceae bacterium]|nr:hypothetical protein [Mycoplasmataceae bacterium]
MELQTQWKRRVEVFKYIYAIRMSDIHGSVLKTHAFEKNEFDAEQLKIVEYFADHEQEVIDKIEGQMAEGWSWNRISSVDQAILIEAYCEVKATAIEKNIVIDQAIVTTKHYSEEKSVPYINAILDKIL